MNYKTQCPNNLDRQKVGLVTNMFKESTHSALYIFRNSQTFVNIKSKLTGLILKNETTKLFYR